jgi:protein-S-isoprenylcysteine O-methyltransferase Ste14
MALFLKNLAFVVFVPGVLAVFLPVYLFGRRDFSIGGTGALGLLLSLAGAWIALWCIWDFWRNGQGTPLPMDPPKVLVLRGLYQYLRNPMYAGVLLVVLGEAILFASWSLVLYAFFAAVGFHLVVVLYEEPDLKSRFGTAYDDYMHRVPRWIPRMERSPLDYPSKPSR